MELVFEDITLSKGKELMNIGMVTSAIWEDMDSDGWEDLIISGEWMPITVFKNNNGTLKDVTDKWGLGHKVGWWYHVSILDVDSDGDMDLIAGNLGLNYKYQASEEKPFEVYANDFDENGHTDIVFGIHKEGRQLPLRGRQCSAEQMPGINKAFPTYREFAKADLAEIYGDKMLNKALHYKANTFSHYWIENEGKGKFAMRKLPKKTQISSVNSIVHGDFNKDGNSDIILAGNLYSSEVETPRNDAGIGLFLEGSSSNEFKPISMSYSGLNLPYDVKELKLIKLIHGYGILVAINNGALRLIHIQ